MRVAVVGMGKMGLLHAGILSVLPNVQLVAVCEKSVVTRRLLAKAFRDLPVLDDVAAFAGLDLDAVFVTTPTPSHYAVAKTVCQERLARHLFVEKPLAQNFSESRELAELVSRLGGVNMVGYLRRFMVTFLKAKHLLAQGVIGEPVSFAVRAFSSDLCGLSENSRVSVVRGGVLRDLGCYAIDLALWFFGDLEVESARIEALTGVDAEDAVDFSLRRRGGSLRGDFSVSWCKEGYRMPEVAVSVRGSGGSIDVNDDKVSLKVGDGGVSVFYRPDLDDSVGFWLGGPEYYREDAYFFDCVRGGLAAEPGFDGASRVDFLIDGIQRGAVRIG